MMLAGVVIAQAAGLLGAPTPVLAKEGYHTAVRPTYPAVVGTALDSCTVCHTNAIPALNPYGVDYLMAGHTFAAIEGRDSDQDGFTNIVEIRALSFPGNAASQPAAPTATPTATPAGPTATPTETPAGPTATPTATPAGPTATPTATPGGPTVTPTATRPHGGEVEFTDIIHSISPTSWVIGARTVRVDANTEIDEDDGPAVAGAWAEVHAVVESDGGLYAREIKIEDDAEETPEATETPRPTRTPPATHTPEASETPHPTRTPEASETPHPTRTPEASETPHPTRTPEASETPHPTRTPEASRTPEDEARFEWEGVIETMSPVSWTVESRVFLIDAQTVIDTRQGPAVIGAWAEVKAALTGAGDLLARRIKIEDRVPDGAKIEFRGPIESIPPPSWVVAGRTLAIDEDTEIRNPERAAIGAIAEVKARRLDDGSLLALAIKIEGDETHMRLYVEWVGVLERFDDASWTVGGRTVQIDDATVIRGAPQVGARVEVKALRQADGSLLALSLHVVEAESEEEWRGVVESITPAAWQIGGRTVTVDARTVFDERDGALAVGVMAEVKALRQADGSLLALRIRAED